MARNYMICIFLEHSEKQYTNIRRNRKYSNRILQKKATIFSHVCEIHLHFPVAYWVHTKTSDFPWLKLAHWNTKRQYATWWTISNYIFFIYYYIIIIYLTSKLGKKQFWLFNRLPWWCLSILQLVKLVRPLPDFADQFLCPWKPHFKKAHPFHKSTKPH